MKIRFILAGIAAVLVAAAAQGQDLKPVRDKATKLYGYQDKSKNWVIEPSYDGAKRFKDGLAEVTVKQEKTKYHGIIDETGRVVIPTECRTLHVSQRDKLIYAEKVNESAGGWLWGVYDYSGNEIWAPQFAVSPSFYDGRGIARSGFNGLKGVVDTEGHVLLPFEYLAIERAFDGYEVLSKDFVRKVFDGRMNRASEFAYPGFILPYDPAGDPVRAAAWHVGAIGWRLHKNNLRAVQAVPGKWTSNATCSTLGIDWAGDRFVRLEPVADEQEEHTFSMRDPFSGKYYTVKAVLCEPDGTPVADVSSWGWIEAEYAEGIIYNAEGKETWMVMRDINCPAMPSFSTPLTRSRSMDRGDVVSCLGLRSYELENMYNPERYADRAVKIINGENAGITYRLPPEAPGIHMSRTINEIHRTTLFRHRFRCGDIVGCKVHPAQNGVELELSDNLVCSYEDSFSDPSYRMEGEEVLFWGPANEYTVVLSARQSSRQPENIKDDVYGSNSSFEIALELYDGYDRFLQTIAVVPHIDYIADGWIVMEKDGIALRFRDRGHRPSGNRDGRRPDARPETRPDARPGERPGNSSGIQNKVKLTVERLPATLSALNSAMESL